MGASSTTELRNGTKHAMKVKVGGSQLATVEAGGKYVIAVDFNATYREYTVTIGVPGSTAMDHSESITVSTDDLCDHKCITVLKEDDGSGSSEGKLSLVKEPRRGNQSGSSTTTSTTKSERVRNWLRSWVSE